MSTFVGALKSLIPSFSRDRQDDTRNAGSESQRSRAVHHRTEAQAEQPTRIHVSSSQSQWASMPGSEGAHSPPTVTRSVLRGPPQKKREFLEQHDPDSNYMVEGDTNEVSHTSNLQVSLDLVCILNSLAAFMC